MSQRAPHDIARERQDRGEQPFKDARELMGKQEAELQNEAQELEDLDSAESNEARKERLRKEAEDSLKEVQREVVESTGT